MTYQESPLIENEGIATICDETVSRTEKMTIEIKEPFPPVPVMLLILTPAELTDEELLFFRTMQEIVKQCNCCRDGDGVLRLYLNGKEIGGLDCRVKGEFMIVLGDLKLQTPGA